jgi:hypothetical protein
MGIRGGMSPEDAIEAASELLRLLLAPGEGIEPSGFRKKILGIEHVGDTLSPAKLQAAIDAAKHDPEMDAVLCSFGAPFIDQAENMPPLLRSFIANKLRTIASAKTATGKRGRHVYENIGRDFPIMFVVARVSERGFDPTRNDAQRSEDSACSIVTKALERVGGGYCMSEDNVEKIWGKRVHMPPSFRQFIDKGGEDLPHGLPALKRIVGS